MTGASLEGFSSYVREVDGECLFVRVVDNFLFCGSRSGDLRVGIFAAPSCGG